MRPTARIAFHACRLHSLLIPALVDNLPAYSATPGVRHPLSSSLPSPPVSPQLLSSPPSPTSAHEASVDTRRSDKPCCAHRSVCWSSELLVPMSTGRRASLASGVLRVSEQRPASACGVIAGVLEAASSATKPRCASLSGGGGSAAGSVESRARCFAARRRTWASYTLVSGA